MWWLSTLGEISEKPQYGWTTKAKHEEGHLKLLRTTDITSGTVDWSKVPYCTEEPDDIKKYLIKSGDILISRAGSIGVSYLVNNPERAVFASYLIRFRPKQSMDEKYVYYYLKSPDYWTAIGASKVGIAVPNVNASKLSQVSIPIAPPDQQKLIVAEIEKQFSRLDEAVAALKRIQANLKRYKASVLKAAVEGKLTEEWRKQHPDVEHASELLKRILSERRKKWEDDYIKKYVGAHGHAPKDNLWKKKYIEPAALDTSNLPKLPKGWVWASLDQILILLTDYHANGSYKILKEHVKILDHDDYAIYVRSTNLENGNFEVDLKFVSEKAYNFLGKSKVFGKEIIIGKIGNAGKIYYMPVLNKRCTLGMNLFMLRFNEQLLSNYIFHHLKSGFSEKEIKEKIKGVGNPSIDKKEIRSLRVALPPLEEEKIITMEIESNLSLVDEIEKVILLNLKRAERLCQSILKKAFSGKLV